MIGLNGAKIILIGKEIDLILQHVLNRERLESGEINSYQKILDGMMFCREHLKCQDLKLRKFKLPYGKKEKKQ